MGDRGKTTRGYRAPRREQQARRTRARILAAARAEFLRSGYAGATMRVIAAAAEVSVQSVEQIFGTKRELLRTVVDVALAGDDEPGGVEERDWVRRAQAATDVDECLRITAAGVREIDERVADVLAVLDQAARSDSEIAALARRFDEQRLTGAHGIVAGLSALAPLRPDTDHTAAADTMWLLMDPVVYRRLTRDRGWSAQDYERWFVTSTRRLLLDEGSHAAD